MFTKRSIITAVIAAVLAVAGVITGVTIHAERVEAAELAAAHARVALEVDAAKADAEFFSAIKRSAAAASLERVRSEARSLLTSERDKAKAALDANAHASAESRDALNTLIANADTLLSASESARTWNAAAESFGSALSAVTESEAAWQAAEAARIEAERVAAEKAAAEAAAAAKVQSGSTKSAGSSGASQRASSSGGGSTGRGGAPASGGSSNAATKANFVSATKTGCTQLSESSWTISYNLNYTWGSVGRSQTANGIPEIQYATLGDGTVVEVWNIDCW